MGRLFPTSHATLQAAPMAIGLFVAVSALVALCAKHATRVTRKLGGGSGSGSETSNSRIAPRFPFASPKQLLTTLGNKAFPLINKKRIAEESPAEADGLWQRQIWMGEKCEPLNFSGVIYYDSDGKRVPELPPKSPHRSPWPSTCSLPVGLGQKDGN
ncbi:uncharacterized protein LOC131235649 [Magnolia sinica]|uniref:uncharacterized protein LOC131235649 n=1 Tax=Magnolia sinica TaxID=86752 RepID=UPI00265A02BD|nr:uncharacterized protein LOC131235649 [Magnolia sinica]